MADCPHCHFASDPAGCGVCHAMATRHGVPVAVIQEALVLIGDEDSPITLGHAIDLILHNAE